MATLKNHIFGSVISMIDTKFDCTDYDLSLNVDLDLGNNYSTSQYISELKSLAIYEDLESFICGLDTCDTISIHSKNGKGLFLPVCDLTDHLKEA